MAAEASAELWIDGSQVACERGDLATGLPTVLDDLAVSWGRQTIWDQPDPGTISFRLHDQRTQPQPIQDIIYSGARVDVWAAAPNPDPVPFTYMFQGFEGNVSFSKRWKLQTFPQVVFRRNRALDPNATSTAGKTTGGSATIAVSTAWSMFGSPGSISITPNGSNNSSAVYPHGAAGLTVFEAGKTYTVSCYYRLAQAQTGILNGNARRITIQTSAGTSAVSNQAANVNGVTRLSLTFTVDPSWTVCAVRIMNGSPDVASVAWYDALLIEEGSTLGPYFDGGSTDTAGYVYDWTGTANNSASTQSYVATNPAASPIIYDNSAGGSVGQGSNSAWLYSYGTRAGFEFNPAPWGQSWVRAPARPLYPGEVWDFSIMTRVGAGTTVDLGFRARVNSNPDLIHLADLPINGGADTLTITGTGAWVTTTGTVANDLDRPVWPTFYIYTPPESFDGTNAFPAIDSLQLVAPAQAERRVLVFSGRVTDAEIEPGPRGTIDITATGAGAASEVQNVSVGSEPWPAEGIQARLDRIADAIPYPLSLDFSLGYDSTLGISLPATGNVIERDVDNQPALDLIRDTADDALGVVWPINHPVERNHLWIESVGRRSAVITSAAEVSACDIPKASFRVTQSVADVITVVDVRYPDLVGAEYIETTVSLIDETAASVHGMLRLEIDTQLSTELGATNLAEAAMDWARASSWLLTGVAFDTKHMNGTGAGAQDLLLTLLSSATRPGAKITITDLPEWVPLEASTGFVEGGTITYRAGRWHLETNLSAAPDTGS